MTFVIEKPRETAPVITICGDAGMGKTSFACAFPSPVVIRAEDGLQAIPYDARPDAFPVLQLPMDDKKKASGPPPIIEQLRHLATAEHDYKTVIIDSVTKLEAMFIQFVCDRDNQPISKASGGYGAGREEVAGWHHKVKLACDMLAKRKGMTVIFLAHADVQRIDPPDDESYSKYSLRLHEKSMSPYTDDVDVIGFLRLRTYLMGDDDERKKAKSDGTRELICYATPSNVSKNRYNVNDPLVIPFDKETGLVSDNPLTQIIPFYSGA